MNSSKATAYSLRILIETYWNVNSIKQEKVMNFVKILIETYWNVNFLLASLKYNNRKY